MAYTQWKFISHSSECWNVQVQGANTVVFWRGPFSWSIGTTSLCVFTWWKGIGTSAQPFLEGSDSIRQIPHDLIPFQRPHLLTSYITFGVRIQHMDFGGTNIYGKRHSSI